MRRQPRQENGTFDALAEKIALRQSDKSVIRRKLAGKAVGDTKSVYSRPDAASTAMTASIGMDARIEAVSTAYSFPPSVKGERSTCASGNDATTTVTAVAITAAMDPATMADIALSPQIQFGRHGPDEREDDAKLRPRLSRE
jgi:hypothetical protein